jgi:hypothetical protein
MRITGKETLQAKKKEKGTGESFQVVLIFSK